MSSAPSALQAALADRYRIERELGAGGMATVYLAHDLRHDRKVAIKVVRADLMVRENAERFLAEIRTAAHLQHPHILGVIDSGDVDGLAYYVMPHVTGESLRDRLTRERQLPVDEAVRIGREVALALDYAHRQGVVHRDIKPENVLLQDGQAMVADFGIALAARTAVSGRLTETGMSPGSPQYMSPEQATGERTIDGRSDLYSLGCVVYEMLAGSPPFTGPTPQALIARHALDRIPRIRTVRPSVPPALERVVLRAMAKVPADRFASAAEFAEALAGGTRTSAQSVRRGALVALAVVSVLAAGVYWVAARPAGKAGAASTVVGALQPALERQRIAVLYFESEPSDAAARGLADGLTDALIDTLSRVHNVSVVPARDVRPYRGRGMPPDSVGRLLRVGAVIAGKVERLGDRFQVSAWVADADSGMETPRRTLVGSAADVLGIQDELARTTLFMLRERPSLPGDARASWLMVQRGKRAFHNAELQFAANDSAGGGRSLVVTDSLFVAAAERNPSAALPWAALASVAYGRSRRAGLRDSSAIRKWTGVAVEQATRALALDPNNADALEVRGNAQYWHWLMKLEPDSAKAKALLFAAKADLERATEVNPKQAGAFASLSHLYFQTGTAVDVITAARRAYEADPYLSNASVVLNRLFLSAYDLAQFDAASGYCTTLRLRFPGSVHAVNCQLYLLTTNGKPADISLAWRLADSAVALTDPAARQVRRLHRSMLVAAVIARASKNQPVLADSARRLVKRSEGTAAIDAVRDLAWSGAFVHAILGDTAEAIRLLKTYVTANPQRAQSLRDEPGWWFREIARDPRYRQLFGAAATGPVQPTGAFAIREPLVAKGAVQPRVAPTPDADRPAVIVLGFQNGSIGRMAAELAPLRAAVTDFMITELGALSVIRVIEGDAFRGDAASAAASTSAATELGRRAGATSVIVGGYVGDASGRMRVTARLIDVTSGTLSATVNAEGLQDTVMVPIASVAAQMKCQVELKVLRASSCSAAAREELAAAGKKREKVPFQAVMLYSRALDAKDHGDTSKAIELFRQSLVAHPPYDAPRRELRKLGVAVPP